MSHRSSGAEGLQNLLLGRLGAGQSQQICSLLFINMPSFLFLTGRQLKEFQTVCQFQ